MAAHRLGCAAGCVKNISRRDRAFALHSCRRGCAGSWAPRHGADTRATRAFRDETARFAAGDVEVADEDLQHKPVAEIGHDCICLAATNAPLRFSAWIPRVAQSLFGL